MKQLEYLSRIGKAGCRELVNNIKSVGKSVNDTLLGNLTKVHGEEFVSSLNKD